MTRIKATDVQFGNNFVLPIDKNFLEEKTRIELMEKEALIKKQQIIKEGQLKAEEILVAAEKELLNAKKIVEQAKLDAQAYVEKSIQKANEESVAIKEQAEKDGFEAGHKDGFEHAIKEMEDKFLANEIFAKSQFDIKHNIVKSAELDIVSLVISIANKVCLKFFEKDEEILKNITVAAIKKLKDKESITITINPELAGKIYSISDELKEKIPQLETIKIIEDINVSPDGTIVESLLSRVDSRLKSQIGEIAEQLMNEYYSIINTDNKEIEEESENVF